MTLAKRVIICYLTEANVKRTVLHHTPCLTLASTVSACTITKTNQHAEVTFKLNHGGTFGHKHKQEGQKRQIIWLTVAGDQAPYVPGICAAEVWWTIPVYLQEF